MQESSSLWYRICTLVKHHVVPRNSVETQTRKVLLLFGRNRLQGKIPANV